MDTVKKTYVCILSIVLFVSCPIVLSTLYVLPGLLMCEGFTWLNVSLNQNTSIRVTPLPVLAIYPLSKSIHLHDALNLTCNVANVEDLAQNVTIEWRKDTKPVTGKFREVSATIHESLAPFNSTIPIVYIEIISHEGAEQRHSIVQVGRGTGTMQPYIIFIIV
jgi:hypothetical protein